MEPVTILPGDCRVTLATLPAASVHCCVTSPPYFNLRDYQGGTAEIGREPTVEAYVAALVDVFRAVRRVLRPDGTCWIVIGDSYSRTGGEGGHGPNAQVGNTRSLQQRRQLQAPVDLGDKQLLLMPARVALALQADGWVLRNDIAWVKAAPMPESVQDRCTQAHEHIFLFSPRPRYYFDAEAIKEPAIHEGRIVKASGSAAKNAQGATETNDRRTALGFTQHDTVVTNRNCRDTWILGPDPLPDAHYAAFPRAIPQRAILAGTSARGACPACGACWRRVVARAQGQRNTHAGGNGQQVHRPDADHTLRALPVVAETWQPGCRCTQAGGDWLPDDGELIATPTGERIAPDPSISTGRAGYNRPRGPQEGHRPITRYEQRRYAAQLRNSPHRAAMAAEAGSAFDHYVRTDRSGARPVPDTLLTAWIARGWLDRVVIPPHEPLEPTPCVVLDPFAGSGRTLAVARSLGRYAVGCELQAAYLPLIAQQIAAATPHWVDDGAAGPARDGWADLPLFAGVA